MLIWVKFTLEKATKAQRESIYIYSSTLSLTLALDGVGGQHHIPAALPLRDAPVPIVQVAGWAAGPVWTDMENLTPPPPQPPHGRAVSLVVGNTA
jgi:hypothetical protein